MRRPKRPVLHQVEHVLVPRHQVRRPRGYCKIQEGLVLGVALQRDNGLGSGHWPLLCASSSLSSRVSRSASVIPLLRKSSCTGASTAASAVGSLPRRSSVTTVLRSVPLCAAKASIRRTSSPGKFNSTAMIGSVVGLTLMGSLHRVLSSSGSSTVRTSLTAPHRLNLQPLRSYLTLSPSADQRKCSVQTCSRGLNNAVTSPVSGSLARVRSALYRLHSGQLNQRLDSSSVPPFALGRICSISRRAITRFCGLRQ